MVKSDDYRLFLESEFKHIRTELALIREQTTKTNGRVDELEVEDKRIEKKVDDAVMWAHHVVDTRNINCPNLTRIQQAEDNIKAIDKNLTLYNIIKEYPKLALGALVVLVVGSIISGLSIIKTAITNDKQDEIIEQINELKYPELYKSTTRGEPYDPFATDGI